jgi:hypothetical protein
VREALALGILAGRVADRPARARRLQDPTSFLMDEDLVVQTARGQSILRLPWFEDGLFVGRQLPEISEMPTPVRRLCVENYTAALAGERGRFAFTSYGHAYSVDAVPVRDQDGRIDAVLAVATPAHSYAAAVAAHLRTAERLDRSAELAEERAERYRLAGRGNPELAERHERSFEQLFWGDLGTDGRYSNFGRFVLHGPDPCFRSRNLSIERYTLVR